MITTIADLIAGISARCLSYGLNIGHGLEWLL